MRATAAFMVAAVSGLAGLLKPIWVSLIWTKVSPSVAAAASLSSRERGTPPLTVQSRPAPAQAMHFSAPRRSIPSVAIPRRSTPPLPMKSSFSRSDMVSLRWDGCYRNEDRGRT